MSMQRLVIALSLALVIAQSLRADDWPQWRGPQRDGVWRETGIVESIPEAGLKVRWRARVGNGYSGPAVAAGRVFVTDHQFRPEVERVLCFDEVTGRLIWEHSYPTDYANMEYGNGPRATPTVHDGKVYTLGTQGHVTCLDAQSGQLVWKRDSVKEFNAVALRYGQSGAPLVVGDLLIVMVGGRPEACVVALDRLTGAERWRALADRNSYSAPIVIQAGGREQLIVWTGDTISSLEPTTGKVFWQEPRKATFDEAEMVASPVLHKDRMLCLSAWNRGSVMLGLDREKPAASVLWKTRSKPTTFIATPLFQDDEHFYASMGDGHLACLDAKTADEVWITQEPTGKRLGTVHLTPNGDRVFLFNQVGNLILARLTPAGYQELGRCLLVEPTAGYRAQGVVTWAHPAYANRHVFARSDRELICASLAAADQTPAVAERKEFKARLLSEGSQWDAPSALAFAPNGNELATGSWQGTVKRRDLASGKELAPAARHKDGVCSVAFSSDGKLMVSAGGSEFTPARNAGKTTGQIKLWDAVTRQELGELVGHTSKVFSAAFSPDGQTLATGAADQTVRLWDTATRTERLVLKGHTDAVWSVAFSPDGQTVASASADRFVIVWDAATGRQLGTLGHDDEVRAVAFSPDGKTIATGCADWSVRLWDATTRQQRAVLSGHHGSVACLTFSPDGKRLASGSGDQTIKLWNVTTQAEVATLTGHRSGVTSIAFSPDGQSLASGGVDDPIRIWDINVLEPK